MVTATEARSGDPDAPGDRPTVPILMYHAVDPRPSPTFAKYIVSPRSFAGQMRWLAMAGYSPVGMDALVANRCSGVPLPARPVVITFDDGFESCVEHAVPVLRSYGFPAIFYLVAGLMGNPSRWLLSERGVEFPLLDWPAARELVTSGFEIGAHTMSHPRLPLLQGDALRQELVQSRSVLEDGLGRTVRHFAYPFGSYDEQVRDLAIQAGFETASSVRIGLSAAGDDLLALHRVAISGTETLVDFVARVRSGRSARELATGLRRQVAGAVRRWTGGPAREP